MPEGHSKPQGFLGRNKLYIVGAISLMVFVFFKYAGVGAPLQDDDFIKVVGTEVGQSDKACEHVLSALGSFHSLKNVMRNAGLDTRVPSSSGIILYCKAATI